LNKKLREVLKKYLNDDELKKLENYFNNDGDDMSKNEKIKKLRKMIEDGEYQVEPEKVAQKMLEVFKKFQR
jgi:anti-sigma28 factor (negative regulator of flagellin synthesis)